MRDAMDGTKYIQGRVRGHRVDGPHLWTPKLWTPTTDFRKNLVLYEWGALVGKLLGAGDMRYRISGMYLEYANVASPGDPVPVPTFTRTRTIDYYNNLVGDVDYLRVALTAHTFDSSDQNLYPHNNRLIFFGRSAGVQGAHGLDFGYAYNSVIYGGALIAMVHQTDYTQDLILSSFYFDVAEQQPKLATSQVGLEWELELQ